MLTLRYVRKTKDFVYPHPISSITTAITTITNTYGTTIFFFYSTATVSSTTSPIAYPLFPNSRKVRLEAKEVVSSFQEWFKCRKKPVSHRIFEILSSQDDMSADISLSRLNLCLSEPLVLEVLNCGKDVLSCLKFFDWAGRQQGFHHTRATFNAIFRIISKARLMSLMLDFLECYKKQRYVHRVSFYNTLVMGYAVAGKPEVALQLLGRMRFQGIDLDEFTYHVLLNALVEENCFDLFDMVAKQIKLRGFENEVTHSVMVKKFCKLREFDEAEEYIRGLMENGVVLSAYALGALVDGFCKNDQFERAGKLVEEFSGMNLVSMEQVYGVWVRDLVQAGKVDGALEFVLDKKLVHGYIPAVFHYNTMICRLLKEDRLEDVFDLLMDMKEIGLSPDDVTMNAALCFFCKAGMVDVALELYDSRKEFGLSPSNMAYNYLINTLCGYGSVDEAYHVLTSSIELGHFPGSRTFSILADALCRVGKLDEMKELVLMALERNFMPSDWVYGKFIKALCRAKRVEDAYLVHGQLTKLNKVAHKNSYVNLITGFKRSSRGDIAARLLMEMQEKGHMPTRKLFRIVIGSLCDMENPDKQFLRLLGMQLSRHQPDCLICNCFIDGAGHARRPELAREVYEMMIRNGIQPNMSSDILMLQSYLKSEKIADALNFFHELSKTKKVGRKLYNTIIVGLCKANKPDYARNILKEMRESGLKPSLICYEELVQSLCAHKRYYMVINLVEELVKVGRHVSSFIGNVLLLYSLKTPQLFEEWFQSNLENLTPQCFALGKLIGVFSGSIRVDQNMEDIKEMIEQCFPLNIYTCNLVLRRLSMNDMDLACEFFHSLCQKGYEPNRWTYDILVHGFFRHNRKDEARRWLDEMLRQGFEPLDGTKIFIRGNWEI